MTRIIHVVVDQREMMGGMPSSRSDVGMLGDVALLVHSSIGDDIMLTRLAPRKHATHRRLGASCARHDAQPLAFTAVIQTGRTQYGVQ